MTLQIISWNAPIGSESLVLGSIQAETGGPLEKQVEEGVLHCKEFFSFASGGFSGEVFLSYFKSELDVDFIIGIIKTHVMSLCVSLLFYLLLLLSSSFFFHHPFLSCKLLSILQVFSVWDTNYAPLCSLGTSGELSHHRKPRPQTHPRDELFCSRKLVQDPQMGFSQLKNEKCPRSGGVYLLHLLSSWVAYTTFPRFINRF